MSVHRRIENFLRRTNMAPTRFGRIVARDPRLVHDLRRGRELRGPLAARIESFLDRQAER